MKLEKEVNRKLNPVTQDVQYTPIQYEYELAHIVQIGITYRLNSLFIPNTQLVIKRVV